MTLKECSHCHEMRPIFKNLMVDGTRLRLCSYCAPLYKDKVVKTKQIKPIKKFSDVRAKRNIAYMLARDIFLQESKNTFCPVIAKLYGKTVRTTEIHHTNGRENDRLTDRSFWLAVSRQGHQYIHANMLIAREQGWITNDYSEIEE
jgi:hypothetical protein